MNTLKIPITSIGETGYVLDVPATVEALQPPGTKTLPVQDIRVKGRFSPLGEDFLFRGIVSGTYSEACYRCLKQTQDTVEVDVAWVFEEGRAHVYHELNHADETEETAGGREQNTARRSFQGAEIDLSPFVWEELVFAMPTRFICHPDCKGICPKCGVNLNKAVCNCADDASDESPGHSGLAALARLFPELNPDKKKE